MLKKSLVIVRFFVCLWVSVSGDAIAETYIAGQAGYAAPSDLSGITTSDLALKSGLADGLKIGGYFPGAANWLGLEFEGFYNQPDVKSQTATQTPGGPQQVDASRMRVAHFAVNVLARYPGETFQPYVGIGGGVNIADIAETRTTFFNETLMAPSLNALVGAGVRDRADRILWRI